MRGRAIARSGGVLVPASAGPWVAATTAIALAGLWLSPLLSTGGLVGSLAFLAAGIGLRRSTARADRPARLARSLIAGAVAAIGAADAAAAGLQSGGPGFVAAALFWLSLTVSWIDESPGLHYLGLFLALALMAVAAVATTHIAFGLLTMALISCTTVTLAILTITGQDSAVTRLLAFRRPRRRPDSLPGPCPVATAPVPAGLFARLASIVTVVIMLSTVFLFLVIPRYGAGYFVGQRRQAPRRSGFTTRLDFGTIGAMQQDDRVVMRVELPDHAGPYPRALRLRGAALDWFDGSAWTESPGEARVLADVQRGFRETSYFVSPTVRWPPKRLVQRVFLAEDPGVLFGCSRVTNVWGRFSRAEKTEDDTLRVVFPAFTSRHYVCISDVSRPDPREVLAGGSRPAGLLARYLQLPALDPRIGGLARELTAGARSDLERALALESGLARRHRYRPGPEESGGRPGGGRLERFLFETREGHCEFFAASMAVMLRTLGIPSRVVTGYLGGRYNPFGGYYSIHGEDAHSWVEALLPGPGWIDFDPTPEGARPQGLAWRVQLEQYWDATLMAWRRYVVDYHLLDQIEAARQVAALLGIAWRAPDLGPISADGGRRLPVLVVLVLVSGLLAAGVVLLVRRSARRRVVVVDAVPGFYGRLLALLAALGIRREPACTARELARRVARELPHLAGPVDRLTDAYLRVRFGGEAIEAAATDAELAALAREPRRPVRPAPLAGGGGPGPSPGSRSTP